MPNAGRPARSDRTDGADSLRAGYAYGSEASFPFRECLQLTADNTAGQKLPNFILGNFTLNSIILIGNLGGRDGTPYVNTFIQ